MRSRVGIQYSITLTFFSDIDALRGMCDEAIVSEGLSSCLDNIPLRIYESKRQSSLSDSLCMTSPHRK